MIYLLDTNVISEILAKQLYNAHSAIYQHTTLHKDNHLIIKQLLHVCTQNKFCGYRKKRTKVRWEHPQKQHTTNNKHQKPRYTDVMPVTSSKPQYKGGAKITCENFREQEA